MLMLPVSFFSFLFDITFQITIPPKPHQLFVTPCHFKIVTTIDFNLVSWYLGISFSFQNIDTNLDLLESNQ